MSSIWDNEFALQSECEFNDCIDNISNNDYYDNQIINNFFNKEAIDFDLLDSNTNQNKDDEVISEDTLAKGKETVTDEDIKSVSTNFLSTKTQRSKKNKEDPNKRDLYLQKNRESAKKCRDKRKQEIMALIKQNQMLTHQISYINQKKELLCSKCQSIMNEVPSYTVSKYNGNGIGNSNNTNERFIVSTANTSPIQSQSQSQRRNQGGNNNIIIKRFGLIGGAIAMLCVFSTMMSIQSNIFSSTNSNYRIRSLSEPNPNPTPNQNSNQTNPHIKNQYYSLKTNSYNTDRAPTAGPYVSFGDYYSIKTKNTFLSKKYNLVNNGKIKIVNDTTVAETNMTECDNCVVQISEQNQVRKDNDMLQFTLLIPLTPTPVSSEDNALNEKLLFYQVDCVTIGFQKNEYYP